MAEHEENNDERGRALREEIFTLIEKSFNPTNYSPGDFVRLNLSITELYSTPSLEPYRILEENMSDDEKVFCKGIWTGQGLLQFDMLGNQANFNYAHSTVHAVAVYRGMQYYRVEILPELFRASDNENNRGDYDCLVWMAVSHEDNYIEEGIDRTVWDKIGDVSLAHQPEFFLED